MVKNVRMIQNVGIVDEMDDGRWTRGDGRWTRDEERGKMNEGRGMIEQD